MKGSSMHLCLANVGVQNKKWNIFKKTAKENFSSLFFFFRAWKSFLKAAAKKVSISSLRIHMQRTLCDELKAFL